jgi:hypothetical protein
LDPSADKIPQDMSNVDHEDIPESYRAVAKYSVKTSRNVATGYMIAADYTGEVSRTVKGDTVYTVYFSGNEIDGSPKTLETAISSKSSTMMRHGSIPIAPFMIGLAAIIALLSGIGVYWFFLRHNVKVFRVQDRDHTFVAKDKINAKRLRMDLSSLNSSCFLLEIDKFSAKALNGKTIEVLYGPAILKHKILYEGNTYRIKIDFIEGTVKAIY